MLCTFMEVLDTTVVNVSLPHIAGNLSATIDEVTWVLTSYLVANAIVLPMTGWLANYFGRKRLLMASVVGFTAASFLCGAAPTLPLLVVFRVIQGSCGGALQPISQAVLLEAFPPEGRGKAMGFWGLGIVVAPVLGPVLGGWLTDSYSWRWVFYINLPVGILSILMVLLVRVRSVLHQARRDGAHRLLGHRDAGRVDRGAADRLRQRAAAGLVQLALHRVAAGDRGYFRDCVPGAGIDGGASGGEPPHLQGAELQHAGVFLMAVLGFVLYGSIVILPIWLQTLMGYPATRAGMTMAPRGLGSMIAMPLVGIILPRFDPRKLLASGLLLGAFSTWQFAQMNLNVGYWDLFWPQFIQGFALGLIFVPLTTISMGRVPRESMGNATSLFNLMRNLGGAVGIAVIAMLNTRYQQKYINILGSHVAQGDPATGQWLGSLRSMFLGSGSGPGLADQRAYGAMFGLVQQQAAMRAFLDVFMLLTVMFLLMIPLVLLMRKPKKD